MTRRCKAYAALRSRPATNSDVYEFVRTNAALASPAGFRDFVDKKLAALKLTQKESPSPWEGSNIPLEKLSLFCSKNAAKYAEIVQDFIQRRDRLRFQDSVGKGFDFFLDSSLGRSCRCAAPFQLYQAVLQNLAHQECLHAPNPRQTIGSPTGKEG